MQQNHFTKKYVNRVNPENEETRKGERKIERKMDRLL
jgi:hypothetical protein